MKIEGIEIGNNVPMQFIKLTKVSDDVFNGAHPKGIIEGYVKHGYAYLPPIVGNSFVVMGEDSRLSTSRVTELGEDNTFKTKNSTYKIELTTEEDGN